MATAKQGSTPGRSSTDAHSAVPAPTRYAPRPVRLLVLLLLPGCAVVTDLPMFREFILPDDDTVADDDSGGDDDSAGDDDDDTPAPCDLSWVVVGTDPVSYSDDVQPLLTDHCAPCHTEQGLGNLFLSTGLSYSNLVDQPNTLAWGPIDRVEPGSPELSYLVHKLVGCEPTDPVWGYAFTSMPPAFPGVVPLDHEQTSVLWTWITQGALDN